MKFAKRAGQALALILAAAPSLGWAAESPPDVVPSKAALDRVTDAAFWRFEAANKAGGMQSLSQAVQGCYRASPGSRLTAMQCLQMDWLSWADDMAFDALVAKDADAAVELRTPYFTDDALKARREVHIGDLVGDQTDDPDAALLIRSQNKIKGAMGTGPQ